MSSLTVTGSFEAAGVEYEYAVVCEQRGSDWWPQRVEALERWDRAGIADDVDIDWLEELALDRAASQCVSLDAGSGGEQKAWRVDERACGPSDPRRELVFSRGEVQLRIAGYDQLPHRLTAGGCDRIGWETFRLLLTAAPDDNGELKP